MLMRACLVFILACSCAQAPVPTPPTPPAQVYAHKSARLSEQGPDIAMLHPPDGFLVDDAAKLVVAFYVSSFCVARLGDELQVASRMLTQVFPR